MLCSITVPGHLKLISDNNYSKIDSVGDTYIGDTYMWTRHGTPSSVQVGNLWSIGRVYSRPVEAWRSVLTKGKFCFALISSNLCQTLAKSSSCCTGKLTPAPTQHPVGNPETSNGGCFPFCILHNWSLAWLQSGCLVCTTCHTTSSNVRTTYVYSCHKPSVEMLN